MYTTQSSSLSREIINSQGPQQFSKDNKNFGLNQISFRKSGNGATSNTNSQRKEGQNTYVKMSNTSYTENPLYSPRNGTPSTKLTEMSSDLSRLKQQLSKIMNQADKFQKKNTNTSQTNLYKTQNDQTIHIRQKQNNLQQTQLHPTHSKSHTALTQKLNQIQDPTTYERFTQPLDSKHPIPYYNPFVSSRPDSYHSDSFSSSSLSNNQQTRLQRQKMYHRQNQKGIIPKISLGNHGGINTNQNWPIYLNQKVKQARNNQINTAENQNRQQKRSQAQNSQSILHANTNQKPISKPFKQYNFKPSLQTKAQLLVDTDIYQSGLKQCSVSDEVERSVKAHSSFVKDRGQTNSYPYQNGNDSCAEFTSKVRTQQASPSTSASCQSVPYSQQFDALQRLDSKEKQDLPSPAYQVSFTKKPSARRDHEFVVNRIMNEQFNKKLQQSVQAQQLKKHKAKEQFQYQEKIIELQHQKRKLRHQLNNAVLQRDSLQVMVNTQKQQRQTLTRKYNQIQETLKINKIQLEDSRTKARLLEKKIDNQILRPKTVKSQYPSFDETLKQQFSEISRHKQRLQQKDEQMMRLKDSNTMNRRQIQSLNNQIKIQQLKSASLLNQSEQKHSVVIQDKQNQIKTLRNLIVTLESKIQFAVKQNNTKDAFMVQHLTGKAKTLQEKQYILNFFKNYQTQFPTNRLNQKIRQQQMQIQRLKKTIIQMASGNVL